MISNKLIQDGIVAKLKVDTDLTTALTAVNAEAGSGDIKEDQYVGRTFNYPAVRVELLPQTGINQASQCELSAINFNVRIYAEGTSSEDADVLAALVESALHKNQINSTTYRIAEILSQSLNPAFRVTERLWMAFVGFSANIYPKTS